MGWLHGGIGDDGRSIENTSWRHASNRSDRAYAHCEQIAINRMDIECIIILSYHLLREFDRNSAYKDTAAFHGEVILRSERNYDLVVEPQEFAEKYPVMSATEILSMIGDHHLLQPCAGEPHLKCYCKDGG